MSTKLLKIIELKGKIQVESGIHIGAGSDAVEIGGSDNPIIKGSNGCPYIPGSSIKGKMRCLLEQSLGFDRVSEQGIVAEIFGSLKAEKPTRLIVRDSKLSSEWQEKYINGEWDVELKYEVTIDRRTGVVGGGGGGGPRNTERIPAGIEFDYEMNMLMFEGDDIEKNKKTIGEGLDLVEKTFLGGKGSRGYGKVKFSRSEWVDVWSNN
jgi:CRISPR-associated protein Csm3